MIDDDDKKIDDELGEDTLLSSSVLEAEETGDELGELDLGDEEDEVFGVHAEDEEEGDAAGSGW